MAEKTIAKAPGMDRTFVKGVSGDDQVNNREATRNHDQYAIPLVDIFENNDGLTVVADLPGVDKDGLEVRVDEGVLTIKGKPQWSESPVAMHKEYDPVSFFREFELSEIVDQEKISAELKHGVLTLFLPRLEKQKPRQIKVKVTG